MTIDPNDSIGSEVDSISETADVTSAATPKAPPPRKRNSFLLGVVLTCVLAVSMVSAGLWYYPDLMPGTKNTALAEQLSAQTSEITSLKAELAHLQDQTVIGTDLAARLTAVEQLTATPATGQDLSTVESALQSLDARVTALESPQPLTNATNAPQDPTQAAAIAALRKDVETLKSSPVLPESINALIETAQTRFDEAESRAQALLLQAETQSEMALKQAALGQVRAAMDTGAPFASALAGLTGLEVPNSLIDKADSGVPTLSSLQAAFPDAARAALTVFSAGDTGATWTDRIGAFFRVQTGARTLVAHDGSDPDAILSRAEAAVQNGDLTAALTEIAGLSPDAQSAMADWAARADQRLKALDSVAVLTTALDK